MLDAVDRQIASKQENSTSRKTRKGLPSTPSQHSGKQHTTTSNNHNHQQQQPQLPLELNRKEDIEAASAHDFPAFSEVHPNEMKGFVKVQQVGPPRKPRWKTRPVHHDVRC